MLIRIKWMTVFVAMAVFEASGASGQSAKSIGELAKYSRADREKILYEGAKKEGKVVWYTSLVPSKDIAKIFEAKYPGVTAEVYRASGIELTNKALAEHRARRHIADLIEATPGALMTLRDEQFFALYHSPHLKNYPDNAKEMAKNGLVHWTTDRESYIGLAYNKNSTQGLVLPKKFDDLLNLYGIYSPPLGA